ncbi:unnamed protein product, partial [Mesorhabditis spiculigera]
MERELNTVPSSSTSGPPPYLPPRPTLTPLILNMHPMVGLFVLCLAVSLTLASQQPEVSVAELCEKSDDTRELCERIFSALAHSERQMEKRKASFIRFGKRSAPMEMAEDSSEELRPALVDKRKASFIRFGRK